MTQNVDMSLSPKDQALIDFYDKLSREASSTDCDGAQIMRRPRAAADPETGRLVYDLTKAGVDCARCEGTGISGHKIVDAGHGRQAATIICICVSRNGGLAPDALDRHHRKIEKKRRRWSS